MWQKTTQNQATKKQQLQQIFFQKKKLQKIKRIL